MTYGSRMAGNSTLIIFLVGLAMGLLFAPKSGKESREELKRHARETLDKMKEKAQQRREMAENAMNQASSAAKSVAADARQARKSLSDQINEEYRS